jgi:hypothetical protein
MMRVNASAYKVFAITPDDEVQLDRPPSQGILVLVAGDITMVVNGVELAFEDVAAGVVIQLVPELVKEATTATVVGLYS